MQFEHDTTINNKFEATLPFLTIPTNTRISKPYHSSHSRIYIPFASSSHRPWSSILGSTATETPLPNHLGHQLDLSHPRFVYTPRYIGNDWARVPQSSLFLSVGTNIIDPSLLLRYHNIQILLAWCNVRGFPFTCHRREDEDAAGYVVPSPRHTGWIYRAGSPPDEPPLFLYPRNACTRSTQ